MEGTARDESVRSLSNLILAGRLLEDGVLPAMPALLDGPCEPVKGLAAPDRIRGMLVGLAIGDALGNTTEGLARADRASAYGEIRDYLPNPGADDRAVGLPSDDTQLAFWTVESLLAQGRFDPEDLSARFATNPILGIGATVRKFVSRRRRGIAPWHKCAVFSAGNGALMRIAPAALPHPAGTSAALWADAALNSMITHCDAASVACCVAFADLVAQLMRRPALPEPRWVSDTFLTTVQRVSGERKYDLSGDRYSRRTETLPDALDLMLCDARRSLWSVGSACEAWGSGSYLLETVPSVLWILERHGHDPEEAIVRSVNDTFDNDTIAAIVGAAVGALHGEQAWPTSWRAGLLGRVDGDDDGRVFELARYAAAQS